MAPRRRHTTSKPLVLSPPQNGGSSADARLREAGMVVRDRAKALASWSRSIPRSIGMRADGHVVSIEATAPVARPAELRLRHPLFGMREHWYGPPGRPFLGPAGDDSAGKAAEIYARKTDDWARKDGYR